MKFSNGGGFLTNTEILKEFREFITAVANCGEPYRSWAEDFISTWNHVVSMKKCRKYLAK